MDLDILKMYGITVQSSSSGKYCIMASRSYLTKKEFENWVEAVKQMSCGENRCEKEE